jgi:hypothetical protein
MTPFVDKPIMKFVIFDRKGCLPGDHPCGQWTGALYLIDAAPRDNHASKTVNMYSASLNVSFPILLGAIID